MPIDPVYRTTRGLTDEVRHRMSKEGNTILATIGDDGSPHLTELLFMLDEHDRVLLPTPHNTRKLKNVRARPVATAFFHEQPGWVSCTGTVEIIEGGRSPEHEPTDPGTSPDRLRTSDHREGARCPRGHHDRPNTNQMAFVERGGHDGGCHRNGC